MMNEYTEICPLRFDYNVSLQCYLLFSNKTLDQGRNLVLCCLLPSFFRGLSPFTEGCPFMDKSMPSPSVLCLPQWFFKRVLSKFFHVVNPSHLWSPMLPCFLAPGTVSCMISFSRQSPSFLIT